MAHPPLAHAVDGEESWYQQQVKRFRSYPRLDRAYRLLDHGRLAEASKEIEAYLALQPGDDSVRLLYVSVLYRTGRHADAIRESDRLLLGALPRAAVRLNRALSLQASGQSAAAAEDYRAVMTDGSAKSGDRIFAASSAVEISCGRREYRICLEGLDQLAGLKPESGKDFDLLQLRAQALLALGRVRDAEATLRVAVRAARTSEEKKQALKALAALVRRHGDASARSAASVLASMLRGAQAHARLTRMPYALIYAQLDTGVVTDAGRLDEIVPVETDVETPSVSEAMSFDEYANSLAASGDIASAIVALKKADALHATAERQYRLGEWNEKLGHGEEAIRHFELAHERDVRSSLYVETLAYAYKSAGRLDDAERMFEGALVLQPGRTDLQQNLAYTYLEANKLARACAQFDALAARTESAADLVQAGYCKRQMKMGDEALAYWLKASTKSESLDLPRRKQLYDDIGYLYLERGDSAAAVGAWKHSLRLRPDETIAANVANAEREPQRQDANEAAQRAETAQNSQEGNSVAAGEAADLAYAHLQAGRVDLAIRNFETAVAQQPARIDLQQDLAYAYLQAEDGTNAARVFKNAIDGKIAARDAESAVDSKAATKSIDSMRREVSELEKRHTFSLYESYRARTGASLGSSATGVGVIPSQGAVEYNYRISESGDKHPLSAFGRVLWGSEAGSLSIDNDSMQGGLGLRYKPIAQQDFYVSAERLSKIGRNAQNDWLLRGSYGWSRGYEIKADADSWNTFTFYSDVGYFTDQKIWATYAEIREGWTFLVANNLLLMPHVTVSGQYQNPDPYNGSYSEAGVGVSLRYLFNESRYAAPRSSAEFLVQYKKGLDGRIAGGWVMTTVILY